jgi:hypothetical protein
MTSVDFVTQLNGMFARTKDQQYPILMAKKIVAYFKIYSPEMLARLLDVICEDYSNSFGPPILGEIKKIRKAYNDRVPVDQGVYPKKPVPQLPENTEGCIDKARLGQFWGAMGQIIKVKDKRARKVLFETEKERILNDVRDDEKR